MRQIWWSGKEPVTFDVEINSLKKMGQIGNAIASPFDHLDLIVETFDEAAVFSFYKIIGDFIPPSVQ